MNPPLLFSSPPPHRPTFLPFPSSLRALVLHIRIYTSISIHPLLPSRMVTTARLPTSRAASKDEERRGGWLVARTRASFISLGAALSNAVARVRVSSCLC